MGGRGRRRFCAPLRIAGPGPTGGVTLALVLAVAPFARGAPFATGSYVGDGTDARSVGGLGFRPDFVAVKAADGSAAVLRTSDMPGDLSKPVSTAFASANLVESVETDGFTVGTDARVNGVGVTFTWEAFQRTAGEVAVGSYPGDGVDDRSITGLGFQPDYLIVMSRAGATPVQRSSSMTGDVSHVFSSAAAASNIVQAFEVDGFQIGTDPAVNAGGATPTVYFYVAWKAVPGKMAVGSYVGNGADDRDLLGLGFAPLWVIIKGDGALSSVHRSASLAGDEAQQFNASPNGANLIQALLPDGFQLGTSSNVNGGGAPGPTYFWMAFGRGTVLSPDGGASGEASEGVGPELAPESVDAAEPLPESPDDGGADEGAADEPDAPAGDGDDRGDRPAAETAGRGSSRLSIGCACDVPAPPMSARPGGGGGVMGLLLALGWVQARRRGRERLQSRPR